MFVLLASKGNCKELLECWSEYEYGEKRSGNTLSSDSAYLLISNNFDICIDMLQNFHKCKYVNVQLLDYIDYRYLKNTAERKARSIVNHVFKGKSMEIAVFISLISYHNYEWIFEPSVICENLLKEVDKKITVADGAISINLRCYDTSAIEAFEARARERA